MSGSEFSQKGRLGLALLAALVLSGCFDLTQKVAIGRDGAGRYQISVTAQGIVGEALKNKSSDLTGQNHALTTTTVVNGNVTETSIVDFKSLSELKFGDDSMSLSIVGNDFFGVGPTRLEFRRVFRVDRARQEHALQDRPGDETGREVMQSVLGNHTYVFSVTLPGSIDRIAPLTVDGVAIKPEVSGDIFHGHTITWRMPLYMMLSTHALTFDVQISAYGLFSNAHTRQG